VSQKGYRNLTIQEGNNEVDLNAPYLLEYDECKVDLSIVVPCYNETKRFPRTFDETYTYIKRLKKEKNITVEMVLVNDGSRDST